VKPLRLIPFLLLGCVTNPYSGRGQFITISESQERELGTQSYQEMLAQENLSHQLAEVDPVTRVGRRLAAVVGKPEFNWEFNVIVDDDTANAWCLPGGKIAFYTGIFPVLQDEAGMAFVMGHEISHALARHGAERISQNLLVGAAGSILEVALGGQQKDQREMVLAAFGMGVKFGVLLPYNRSHESEADAMGLDLMARAGYDPRESVAVWKRMAQLAPGGQPEFLSTHPSHETRIRDLEERLPVALELYEKVARAPVSLLPRVGGRKGAGGRRGDGLTAAPGTITARTGTARRALLEDGRRAISFEVSFNCDLFLETIHVTGPKKLSLVIKVDQGVSANARRLFTLVRPDKIAPEFSPGRHPVTFEGTSSGKAFRVSTSYEVR
jgi:Zn-dependent protease with chaperone function